MKKKLRRRILSVATASVFASLLSATANAQMPGHQFSPWNQIGRAWGIGIGDGYHECANCPQDRSKGYGINAFTTSGERAGRGQESAEKASWFSKMNPFAGNAGGCGVPGCTVCAQGSQHPSYTVLPPSSGSYQQFATPAETPLPWHSAPQTQYQPSTSPNQFSSPTHQPAQQYPHIAPQAIPQAVPDPQSNWLPNTPPSTDHRIPSQGYPEYQTPQPRRNEPTPAERPDLQPPLDQAETVEPRRMPDTSRVAPQGEPRTRNTPPLPSPNDDLPGNDYLLDSDDVPPPPALRRPRPDDRPLGQDPMEEPSQKMYENEKSPRLDDSDSLLPMDDESFELVPDRALPPVTRYRPRQPAPQSFGTVQASSVTYSRNTPAYQQPRATPPTYRNDTYYSQPQSNRYENPYTYQLR